MFSADLTQSFIGGLNMQRLFLHVIALLACASSTTAQEDRYPGRPGLTFPEGTPKETAACGDLSRAIRNFRPQSDQRVDLWATGPLTIVDTDGVLFYLGICSQPGIRVLCVTYSDNDMRLGEVVTVRGGMRIQDDQHVLLDPCLASRD
ncbi:MULTISPECIES: hypothetical protein [Agrobacterium tumefaciens complex]|uniref:hypothetical protein n=1 Tax=Agrobacterium tumefaciens complex TaxID=1183400 RepID=UPI000DD024F0|nr:hypothetical protein [Agrobacterium fabrum]KAA3498513.1 hypothetical protein DXM26_25055 [Agrobacterium tumefaciens]QTQ86241.1 hypothetical protein J8N08_23815 [Agrobacterium tumefaciens]WCK79920.1 hypothetical protein G6L39_023675 [Agrobacterium fabrum]